MISNLSIRRSGRILGALTPLALACCAQPQAVAQSAGPSRPASPPVPALTRARLAYSRMPLTFEPNDGQASRGVQYVSRGPGYRLSLSSNEAIFALRPASHATEQGRRATFDLKQRGDPGRTTSPPVVLRMRLAGAPAGRQALGQDPLPGKTNIYRGNDQKEWRAGVRNFGKVRYNGVYPGIDLVYYGNQRQLEYDFNVAAHADPSRIGISFSGARSLRVDNTGDLVLTLSGGDLRWHAPVAYQMIDGKRKVVSARYVLKQTGKREKAEGKSRAGSEALQNRRVCFALASYDASKPLVIDPQLAYSTFLGGSGADIGNAIAVDAAGNAYVTGYTQSVDFPTLNPQQPVYGGGDDDVFVAKFTPTGTLLYSTYFGGSRTDEGHGIAVDASGNAYVTGQTSSVDFPTKSPFQSQYGGAYDAFIAKFGPTGALVYSTYVGGTQDDVAYGIAVDSANDAYITGYTLSTNFPTPGTPYQAKNAGLTDVFVSKLNAKGNQLLFSTYLGSTGDDIGQAIAVDSQNNVYVTGFTDSITFPTLGAFQSLSGGNDAFLAKFNATGVLQYSTYLGGTLEDRGEAVAVDNVGGAYVAGWTYSTDFPIIPLNGSSYQTHNAGGSDAFIAKLDTTQQGQASLIYSTYFGGPSNTFATGIALDAASRVVITGYFDDDAFKNGLEDAFVAKLDPALTTLLYGTNLRGSDNDEALAIALDPKGNIYLTGDTSSPDFPTTPGVAQQVFAQGVYDAFVAKIQLYTLSDFNGDGHPDIVLQDPNTGLAAIWYMNQSIVLSGAFLSQSPTTNWQVVGVGDFNGDGLPDLVLQSNINNSFAIWLMNGPTVASGIFVLGTPPPGWRVMSVNDFTGNGIPDLILQNMNTGQVAVEYLNAGATAAVAGAYVSTTPPPGWLLVGSADFDGDGMPDLVFQNTTTGQIMVWYMNGTVYSGNSGIVTVNPGAYQVVAVGDFNGDGMPDLILQNPNTGQLALWTLNNTTVTSGVYINGIVGNYRIMGPR